MCCDLCRHGETIETPFGPVVVDCTIKKNLILALLFKKCGDFEHVDAGRPFNPSDLNVNSQPLQEPTGGVE